MAERNSELVGTRDGTPPTPSVSRLANLRCGQVPCSETCSRVDALLLQPVSEAAGGSTGKLLPAYARVERNALILVMRGSFSSCLYKGDSTAISAILPSELL